MITEEKKQVYLKDKIVKKLLKDNITLDKIIEYTELSKEDVEEIINESNHE